MAKKEKDNTIWWIAGTALVTGGAFYVAQNFLKQQEEMKEYQLRQKLAQEKNPDGDDED